MYKRVVYMKFKPELTVTFEEIFRSKVMDICAMPGCRGVELYEDINDSSVRITYSLWDSPADLDAYRSSSFFKEVWSKTKVLFAAAPQAYTMRLIKDSEKGLGDSICLPLDS
jgi:heme-degrading monooxygenase HmoA